MVSSTSHELANFRHARDLVDDQLDIMLDKTVTMNQDLILGAAAQALFRIDTHEIEITGDLNQTEKLTALLTQLNLILQAFSESELTGAANSVLDQIQTILDHYRSPQTHFQTATILDDEVVV